MLHYFSLILRGILPHFGSDWFFDPHREELITPSTLSGLKISRRHLHVPPNAPERFKPFGLRFLSRFQDFGGSVGIIHNSAQEYR
jgi:hypothetical protein